MVHDNFRFKPDFGDLFAFSDMNMQRLRRHPLIRIKEKSIPFVSKYRWHYTSPYYNKITLSSKALSNKTLYLSVQSSVADGFGDVLGLEVGAVFQVGDGAGDFADFVV